MKNIIDIKLSKEEQERISKEVSKVMKRAKIHNLLLFTLNFVAVMGLFIAFKTLGERYNVEFLLGGIFVFTALLLTSTIVHMQLKNTHSKLEKIVMSSEEISNKIREFSGDIDEDKM